MLAQVSTAGFFVSPESVKVKPARSSTLLSPHSFVKASGASLYFSPHLMELLPETGEATPASSVEVVTLDKAAFDREIEPQLPRKHSIRFSTLLSLIQEQWDGKPGVLLRRSNENNLVYLSGLPVQVSYQYRSATQQRWSVAEWSRDEQPWPKGTKIIYEP